MKSNPSANSAGKETLEMSCHTVRLLTRGNVMFSPFLKQFNILPDMKPEPIQPSELVYTNFGNPHILYSAHYRDVHSVADIIPYLEATEENKLTVSLYQSGYVSEKVAMSRLAPKGLVVANATLNITSRELRDLIHANMGLHAVINYFAAYTQVYLRLNIASPSSIIPFWLV